MKHVKSAIIKVVLSLMIFLICGVSDADTACQKSPLSVLKAQTMDQAQSTDYAQSALEAIRRGDTQEAIVTLEAQLQAGITILHSAYPRLEKENGFTEKEKQMVGEVIKNADLYAHKYNIKE